MKLWLKSMSAVLACVMLAGSMLVGCSKEPAQTPTPTSSGNVASTVEHKLKIMGSEDALPVFSWKTRDHFEVFKKIEELFATENITLEYETIATEQYQVVIQTRMASGSKLPDIAQVSSMDNASVLALAQQGISLPLNDAIKQFSNGNIDRMYTEIYPTARKLTLAPDGELYWFSSLHKNTYNGTQAAPFALTVSYRKDWADKLNIAEPANLEQFSEMLRAFRTKDANGNGKQDEILNVIADSFGNGVAQWFGLGTNLISYNPTTNKMVSPWYQTGIKEYFKYLRSLVEEKIIDASILGNTEMTNQRMAENKIAATYEYAGASWLEAGVTSVTDAEYQPLMPLSSVEGIVPAMVTEPPELVWDKFILTKTCTDIEGAIRFFDLIYSDEYATLCKWGIEGQTFKMEDGHKVAITFESDEKKAELGYAAGYSIIAGILPKVQLGTLETDIDDAKSESKKDFLRKMITYSPSYPNDNGNFLAMPTDEESQTIQKYTTNLKTYSAELCTKIVLGQKSIDDMDQYIKEMQDLGLDKVLAVEQARLDRFNSNK
ncbi:MAG: extracellular solute-binding protein [Oscillospiraceae bacterium]